MCSDSDVNSWVDVFGLDCGSDLEDELEQALIDNNILYTRGQKFGNNGDLGEIDFEVADAIIEVTVSPKGKLSQIEKYRDNRIMNPTEKPIILFGWWVKMND